MRQGLKFALIDIHLNSSRVVAVQINTIAYKLPPYIIQMNCLCKYN